MLRHFAGRALFQNLIHKREPAVCRSLFSRGERLPAGIIFISQAKPEKEKSHYGNPLFGICDHRTGRPAEQYRRRHRSGDLRPVQIHHFAVRTVFVYLLHYQIWSVNSQHGSIAAAQKKTFFCQSDYTFCQYLLSIFWVILFP